MSRIVALLSVLSVLSCTTPTSMEVPDETAPPGNVPSATATGPSTPGVNPVAPVPGAGTVSGTVRIAGGKAYCRAVNGTDETVPIFLALYDRPGTQTRIDLRRMDLRAGGSKSISLPLPVCDDDTCGERILAQIDCIAYEEPPKTYVFGDRMPGQMLDFAQYEIKCPDCPPPPPCVEGGPKKCPEQTWDPILCQYVGPCPCVEQECLPNFDWWGEPDCKCVCSLTADDCEEDETFNARKCKCIPDTPPCLLPPPGSFYQKPPFGSPASECASFGLVPGQCDMIFRKGGPCYEVLGTSTVHSSTVAQVCCVTPQHGFKCFNKSHDTCCECPEE